MEIARIVSRMRNVQRIITGKLLPRISVIRGGMSALRVMPRMRCQPGNIHRGINAMVVQIVRKGWECEHSAYAGAVEDSRQWDLDAPSIRQPIDHSAR